MALANSVNFFKLGLPEVEPCDCVQGGMVLHISEEKVGIMDGILRISGLILPCDSLLSSLFSFSFFLTFLPFFLRKHKSLK